MSDTDAQVPLPDLNAADAPPTADDIGYNEDENAARVAADLEAVFDVPVQLDRRVGESIDIYVNNRLVARGEVVLVEDKLGVTMTEIIKAERN
jgi:flagellar motor switch protein FliN/FliY